MIEIQDGILDKGTKNSQPKGDEDRIKHLYEKLQQTQIKLYESKNICVSLKQEINKLHKVLFLKLLSENLYINKENIGHTQARAHAIHNF